MKRFLSVLTLVCVTSIPALAGNIPTDGISAPGTEPGEVPTVGITGDIPTGGLTYQIADTTVDLIQMLLGFGV
ncbi:MAG TPA: hypothetical protein VJU84_05830 [Pyrinomonadaceae bacterium]|nr:hypothetical protein [Pyrinomonadaceae bacterium]